jgi:hypothetical protein
LAASLGAKATQQEALGEGVFFGSSLHPARHQGLAALPAR